jgi:hypothetical protein
VKVTVVAPVCVKLAVGNTHSQLAVPYFAIKKSEPPPMLFSVVPFTVIEAAKSPPT